MNLKGLKTTQQIQSRILTIRSVQVLLDEDLAEMYQVKTHVLNQSVKRNIRRFPEVFMFQLTKKEFEDWNKLVLKSQNVISKEKRGGRRKRPFAFTEQGVAMLSSLLKSEIAINVSIQIINAFVEMRKFLAANASLFQRLEKVENKQLDADHKFERIFKALESEHFHKEKGVFYDGQVFDAYTFVADIIRKAVHSIVLIDNYIDDTVLTLLSKRKKGVTSIIYTKKISKQLKLDLDKHNTQYPHINIHTITNVHDRFLIIDQTELYHFGASLKDLGKKWFAFSKMDAEALNLIDKINRIDNNG